MLVFRAGDASSSSAAAAANTDVQGGCMGGAIAEPLQPHCATLIAGRMVVAKRANAWGGGLSGCSSWVGRAVGRKAHD